MHGVPVNWSVRLILSIILPWGKRGAKRKKEIAKCVISHNLAIFLGDSNRQLLSVRLSHSRLLPLPDMITISYNERKTLKN